MPDTLLRMDLPGIGDLFEGRYRIDAVAGAGGFAKVFRAVDVTSMRDVALKVLTPPYSAELVARFARETRAHAGLRDPHTVSLLRHGTSATGLLWVAFEYIPGRELAELLASAGPLDPADVAHILRQILCSLGEAHRLGLLHRDIKPENILVFEHFDDPLRVKVLDFGLARPAARETPSSVTRTGEVIGTPRYMSPEQLLDEPLTPASDLYSVGLVALEMMFGRQILHGAQWDDQRGRVAPNHRFSLPAPRDAEHGRLLAVVARMVERDPRDRFPSAEAARAALDALERPTASAPPSATNVASSRPARRAAAAVAVAVCATAAAAVAIVSWPGPPTKPPPAAGPATALPTALLRTATTPAPAPATALPARPSGCGRAPSRPGTFRESRMLGLQTVGWFTHVPVGYDPARPHPVVVLFHQDLRDGAGIIAQTKFDALADEEQFLVVAPNFTGRKLPGPWREPEDVREIRPILDALAEDYCVDRGRIFLVGHGISGFAVERLACEPWVTAIATNGFRLREEALMCEPARPVPSLHLAPMTSARIPVAGGTGCTGYDHKIPLEAQEALWRTRNGCGAQATEYVRHAEHVCWTWECAQPFVSCHVMGGFNWPGSEFSEVDFVGCDVDKLSDFPATRVIWEFFENAPPSDMRD